MGIVSGGIHDLYEYASNNFGLKVDYVSFAAKLNFNEKGELAGGRFNSYDYDGKLDVFKTYCRNANATINETLYVGDSNNDIPYLKCLKGWHFLPTLKS